MARSFSSSRTSLFRNYLVATAFLYSINIDRIEKGLLLTLLNLNSLRGREMKEIRICVDSTNCPGIREMLRQKQNACD